MAFDDEADAFRNINTLEELGKGMTPSTQTVSCLDGYDPDALHVDKAREAIRACLSPITATETLAIRQTLGRVLAAGHRAVDQRAGARQLGDGRLRACASPT